MHEINAADFRRELFALIAKADSEWEGDARSGSSKSIAPDRSTYPAVAKALHSIQCFRRRESDDLAHEWIIFPNWGGRTIPAVW